MPIITAIDQQASLVHHSVEGVLSFQEILQAIDRLFTHPDFRPEMDILMEVTPGATSALTSVEIIKVVDMLRALGEKRGTGRSVVVAPDDADFGLVRALAYRLEDGSRPTTVFKTLEQALAWLAQDED